jgi:hypothetical protein
MLDVLLLPPQQRSGGNHRKYNAGSTKRGRTDHVGGHSNIVARDQPKQQRGRQRGGQTKNHIDRLHATTIAWSHNDPSVVPNRDELESER